MAANAGYVGADGELCLFSFKAAVSVVAAAAVHRALQHFVMEGFSELSLRLGVTGKAELRLVLSQHCGIRHAGILVCRLPN